MFQLTAEEQKALEAELLQRVLDREDRERQEGFSFDSMVIGECQAQDRAIGKLGFSGRP